MELKEYLNVIKRYRWIFGIVWAVAIMGAVGWQITRPASWDVVWGINVSRQASQPAKEYRFDQYYRLEADKDFGENIVRWLADPGVASKIITSSQIQTGDLTLKRYAKMFRAERLAPSYIQVKFSVKNRQDATKIIGAAKKVLETKTADLNSKKNPDQNWFTLIFDSPVIAPHQASRLLVALVGGGGGLLLATLIVLIIHYWQEDEKNRH
jgi:hypothetical protein